MNARTIALLGGGVVVVALVAWLLPRLAKAYAVSQAQGRCEQLKRERDQRALAGGDVVELARLDVAIRACSQEVASLGGSSDLSAVGLGAAEAKAQQIDSEFGNYRATNYVDWLKRNNTRETMLRLGGEMVAAYDQAVNDAETVGQLDKVRASIRRQIARSEERRSCYGDRASGCDRSGDAEPEGMQKAEAERQRVTDPLRGVLGTLETKRSALAARESRPAAGSLT